jgi:hypothetical protein
MRSHLLRHFVHDYFDFNSDDEKDEAMGQFIPHQLKLVVQENHVCLSDCIVDLLRSGHDSR